MKKLFIGALIFYSISLSVISADIDNKKTQTFAPGDKIQTTQPQKAPVQKTSTQQAITTTSEIKVLTDSQFQEMIEQKKKILNEQMNLFLIELLEKQIAEYKKANEERKQAAEDRLAAAEELKKAKEDRIAAAEERKRAFEDEKKKVEEDRKIALETRLKAEEERKKELIERRKNYVYDYELYKQEKYVNLILDGKLKHPQIINDVIKFFESDKIIDGDAKDIIIKKLKSIYTGVEKKEISIEDGINFQKYNKWLDVKNKLFAIIDEQEKSFDVIRDVSKYINNDSDVDGKNKEKVLDMLKEYLNAVAK